MSAGKAIQILAFAVLITASACNVKKNKKESSTFVDKQKTESSSEINQNIELNSDSTKTNVSIIENADEIIIEHIVERDSSGVKTTETKRTTKRRNLLKKDLTQNKAIKSKKSSEGIKTSNTEDSSTIATESSEKDKKTSSNWFGFIILIACGIISLFFIWKYLKPF